MCLWCGMHVDVLTDQWWSVCVEGGWYVGVWVWCGIHVDRSVVVYVCWGLCGCGMVYMWTCGQISHRCLDVFLSCFTVFFETGFVSVSPKFVVLSELTGSSSWRLPALGFQTCATLPGFSVAAGV